MAIELLRAAASLFFGCLAILFAEVFVRVWKGGPAAVREHRLKSARRRG